MPKPGNAFTASTPGVRGFASLLPPVKEAVPQLRNPVVCRGLTELRKVVNALIRQYGKPSLVRVELARDLKRSRQQREDLTKQNRDNERSRNEATKDDHRCLLCDGGDVSNSRRSQGPVGRGVQLGMPLYGKVHRVEALVGKQSQFDIEHIVPFSKSLDNSFLNKTLCYHEENRGVKRNQTPYEAYGSNETESARSSGALSVFADHRHTPNCGNSGKKNLEDDFAARMLQDTRYMSRLASRVPGAALRRGDRRRSHTARAGDAGRVTAFLRDEWGLNAILADGDHEEKNRDDHRHHAVDAAASP